LIYQDGLRYKGFFHGGLMQGHGRLIWPSGDQLTGQFKNGEITGCAKMVSFPQ
jgi:hypothetical protein